jgi:hypothetical protein
MLLATQLVPGVTEIRCDRLNNAALGVTSKAGGTLRIESQERRRHVLSGLRS